MRRSLWFLMLLVFALAGTREFAQANTSWVTPIALEQSDDLYEIAARATTAAQQVNCPTREPRAVCYRWTTLALAVRARDSLIDLRMAITTIQTGATERQTSRRPPTRPELVAVEQVHTDLKAVADGVTSAVTTLNAWNQYSRCNASETDDCQDLGTLRTLIADLQRQISDYLVAIRGCRH